MYKIHSRRTTVSLIFWAYNKIWLNIMMNKIEIIILINLIYSKLVFFNFTIHVNSASELINSLHWFDFFFFLKKSIVHLWTMQSAEEEKSNWELLSI